MKTLLAVLVLTLVFLALSQAKKAKAEKKSKEKMTNVTVTDEVTLEFEILNYNGDGEDLEGKVVIGLFGKQVPMTSFNFKKLCSGVEIKGNTFKYQGTACHRVVDDMLLQCGDVTTGDGSGSESCYGGKFRDENFDISHSSGGIISMANQGPDTNGSQFFLLFTRARYLDEHHVAFGKVVKGFDLLETINEIGSKKKTSDPLRKILIKDCSVEEMAKPYKLTAKQLMTDDLEA